MTNKCRWVLGVFLLGSVVLDLLSLFPDQYFNLIACDVGQGDAILVTYGSRQMLIDTGPDEKVLHCLKKHLPAWDKTLELVVATHADNDHVGGLPAVLEAYQVKQLMIQKSSKDTADFQALRALVSRKEQRDLHVITPTQSQLLSLTPQLVAQVVFTREVVMAGSPQVEGKTEIELSAVMKAEAAKNSAEISENNGSIVLLLHMGTIQALLTGDIDTTIEAALINRHLISDIDILKVAHHGSKTSTSPSFLALLRPEISLLSVGKPNPYGHPSTQVLARLRASGSQVWRTDEKGTIEIVSNGITYWKRRSLDSVLQGINIGNLDLKIYRFE